MSGLANYTSFLSDSLHCSVFCCLCFFCTDCLPADDQDADVIIGVYIACMMRIKNTCALMGLLKVM